MRRAKYPPNIWGNPELRVIVKRALVQVPLAHRDLFLTAVADLDRIQLLQPPQPGKDWQSVSLRRQQWRSMAGGRAGEANIWWVLSGATVGSITGAILGIPVPEFTAPFPMAATLALVGIPLGGYTAHMLKEGQGFHDGMVQVIVNERLSLIRPEKVTAQVRLWVPKTLLAFRAHDWRYDKFGRPYLWLMVPDQQRILMAVVNTISVLLLPNDPHRASDAAIYAQRTRNRQVSDSAMDHAEADEGEPEEPNRFMETLPYLSPAAIVLGGILMVIMSTS